MKQVYKNGTVKSFMKTKNEGVVKMKKGKLFIILVSFVMTLTLFVACNGDDSNVENPEPSADTYSEGNKSDCN